MGVPVSTEGTILGGRYRVLRHLGSGGMASVLLCRDERLDREVAVKRLHADSPAETEQRFLREAKLGASLNHPNLVSVFDTAIDDEGVLIVMEYVEGEALSRALKRGPLDHERVAAMARDLGDALDHAHEQGVVHRDVKPANVLLRRDGVTKLVDLGIATASDQTRITRSGMVLGTASYMSPEQLEGGETGPATDIYALGVVLYEALSGERARQGATPLALAHQIASSPPPDLREALPGAPRDVAAELRRAMARDPAERQASAGKLGAAVARGLEAGEPSTAATQRVGASQRGAPPPAAPPRARRARAGRPRPAAIAILALLFLALAVATIVGAALSGDDGGGGRRAPRRSSPRRTSPSSRTTSASRRPRSRPSRPRPRPMKRPRLPRRRPRPRRRRRPSTRPAAPSSTRRASR